MMPTAFLIQASERQEIEKGFMQIKNIKYDRPELNTEYDYVGLIDGLSDAERKKFAITSELKSLLLGEGLSTATALVHTSGQLLEALDKFYEEAKSGKRFMLHFVAHGNQEGIQVGNDFVQWDVLNSYLSRINNATGETLLLNLSTCKGLHGIKIVNGEGGYPFFGLIGAREDLLVSDALKANKIMYEKWLKDTPVQKIVPETNNELGKEILFNISAEGYRKLTS